MWFFRPWFKCLRHWDIIHTGVRVSVLSWLGIQGIFRSLYLQFLHMFNPATFFMCLYQDRDMGGHVYMCKQDCCRFSTICIFLFVFVFFLAFHLLLKLYISLNCSNHIWFYLSRLDRYHVFAPEDFKICLVSNFWLWGNLMKEIFCLLDNNNMQSTLGKWTETIFAYYQHVNMN